MHIEDTQSAEQKLFETGTLVLFRVLDTNTEVTPDQENIFVRVELMLEDDEEDVEPEEFVEWGAFGFLFAITALSFHDARPRGASELHFQMDDALTVADFLDALSFGRDGLRVQTDYLAASAPSGRKVAAWFPRSVRPAAAPRTSVRPGTRWDHAELEDPEQEPLVGGPE
jgi:hypothetical protein